MRRSFVTSENIKFGINTIVLIQIFNLNCSYSGRVICLPLNVNLSFIRELRVTSNSWRPVETFGIWAIIEDHSLTCVLSISLNLEYNFLIFLKGKWAISKFVEADTTSLCICVSRSKAVSVNFYASNFFEKSLRSFRSNLNHVISAILFLFIHEANVDVPHS